MTNTFIVDKIFNKCQTFCHFMVVQPKLYNYDGESSNSDGESSNSDGESSMTGGNRLDGETSMVGIDWLPSGHPWGYFGQWAYFQ